MRTTRRVAIASSMVCGRPIRSSITLSRWNLVFPSPISPQPICYDHIILADERPPAERLDAQRQALHYLDLSAANSHDEQQRLLTLVDRQLVDDDWHGLAARIDAALRAPGCSAPDWLPVFASIFGYGDLIEDLVARVSVCDPLNAINFNSRVRSALASGKPERALAILAAAEKANGGTPTFSAYRVQALVMAGHVDDAEAELAKLEPTGENYYRARLMVGLATGESAASIHAGLQGVDRSQSLYKMWQMNDVVEAALRGDRATANRLAAEIDARPGGGLVLAVIASDGLCGAPFDLEATPNFKARLAESGLPWSPARAMRLPAGTAEGSDEREAFLLRRAQAAQCLQGRGRLCCGGVASPSGGVDFSAAFDCAFLGDEISSSSSFCSAFRSFSSCRGPSNSHRRESRSSRKSRLTSLSLAGQGERSLESPLCWQCSRRV